MSKTIDELGLWLHGEYDVEKIDFEQMYELARRSIERRIELGYLELEDEIEIYALLPTPKNEKYVADNMHDRNYVYVIFEPLSKRIHSNCTVLSLELKIAYGITQEDMDKRTFRLLNYLARIDILAQVRDAK